MTTSRRLAAILAVDVAGYSRLMGADEEGTHERLSAHFRELVDPKIKEHRGRIVKNTGDGLLAEFPSVVDAVRCAVEIQRGMIDREVREEQRIRFRIGINLGDVIVEEHDIFGDGVNVAARLEALAEPGGICVSRMVRDNVPIPLLQQAIRLSPRDPSIGNWYVRIGVAHLVQLRIDDSIVWFKKAHTANPGNLRPHVLLASAYGLGGKTEHAASELAEARRLSGGDRLSSIARMKVDLPLGVPKIRALLETTLFAVLRKAGVPEE